MAIWIPWFAGLIFPPNYHSAAFNLTYAPSVTLTLSDDVANHTTTTITPLTLTATFGDPVVGVAVSDFLLRGCSGRNVSRIAPNVYTISIDMGPSDRVVVGMEARCVCCRVHAELCPT